MFLKRFPENQLIKKIKISGPFISVYVPEAGLQKFLDKYNKLLTQYKVLSIGEGLMHDFAHYTHNKHLSFLIKDKAKEKHEHFHFILPETVNEVNLALFLDAFDDHDLSQEQKKQLVEEFKEYSHSVTLETLLEQIKSYNYLIFALFYRDHYLSDMMPLFTGMLNSLEPYMSKDQDEKLIDSSSISPDVRIKIGDDEVCARDADNNLIAFVRHIGILSSFAEIINNLNKNKNAGDISEIIIKVNELFKSVSMTPFPDFLSLSPPLFNELKTHFPFIDRDLNNLYTMLKQQLAICLKTEGLIFNPKIFFHPIEDVYCNQAIHFLNKQGLVGQKIIDTIMCLQEGKNSLNPYWMNSGTNLQGIVDAVLSLKKSGADLNEAVQNQDSELNQALNKPRFLPLTTLGSFGIHQSKSTMKVDEGISKPLNYQ
ncbi:hypothetical protein DGG96_12820 [Legionella qingyii]|uniref:Uncharacterized protein n=1 Tax=Legionella qingyii TaxID=2184757 RepID=A0A317TZB9_9GAMM|nr:hypothetical protein [Legionella qingyii]PWY55064.1 hypothetical protein DGG96_12820 [Legionella qingyii]RUR25510.1 hypothetical protein ELY20_03390 [Legionella qingyii]RUR28380.1 hypothetical protein ELY16_02620 [Legionella qingyii]